MISAGCSALNHIFCNVGRFDGIENPNKKKVRIHMLYGVGTHNDTIRVSKYIAYLFFTFILLLLLR